MSVPNILFEIANRRLGGTDPTVDSTAGMVLSGVALPNLPLTTPKAVYSLKDTEALGIDEAYDTTNRVKTWQQISDFYSKAAVGTELWVMLVSQATSISDICDKGKDIARKLLMESNGNIRIWGVAVSTPATYTPVTTKGIDQNVLDAAVKAQALCDEMALTYYIPTRCLLPGRCWTGDAGTLADLKEMSNNRSAILLHGMGEGNKDAAVGFVLGLMSALQVQRNIGRVAGGALGVPAAYLTDGATRAEDIMNIQNTLHDKGYIFPLVRPGRAGYFYNDDPTATSNADDYSALSRGRVIDKVERLAYDVYLDFVNDDYSVTAEGNPSPVALKSMQGSMEDVVNQVMTSANEISGFQAYVNPVQDVVGTGVIKVELNVQPRACYKTIKVVLGFVKTLQ
jgi:hypothetical protein